MRRQKWWTGLIVMLPLLLGAGIYFVYSQSPLAAYGGLTRALEESDEVGFHHHTTERGRSALFFSRQNWLHKEVDETTRYKLPRLRPLGAYLNGAQRVRVTAKDNMEANFTVRFKTSSSPHAPSYPYRLEFIWTPDGRWKLNNFYQANG